VTNIAPLRVVFAGTPEFAARHLQAILTAGRQQVEGVYTQPDRPAGRGKKLSASPVKQLARQHGLPVFQPTSLKSTEVQAELAQLQPDLLIVVAYGLILPRSVLAIPRHGCINVHASLLPRWRGAAPVQRAIEAGDTQTGITIMQMDAGLDTGPMLYQVACNISADDTGGSLHDRLARLGPAALLKVLTQISAGETQPQAQDDSLSTYAAKISKQEAQIEWHLPAAVIERKIRAYNPFPVAFSRYGEHNIRIHGARVVHGTIISGAPGEILAVRPEGLAIACGSGTLLLTEIQLPGKKSMPVSEFMRGHPHLFQPGTCLGQ